MRERTQSGNSLPGPEGMWTSGCVCSMEGSWMRIEACISKEIYQRHGRGMVVMNW
jgi:hypothetical protein